MITIGITAPASVDTDKLANIDKLTTIVIFKVSGLSLSVKNRYVAPNRMIPINIFLKQEWLPFRPYLTTFVSKDCHIIAGPNVSLSDLNKKRIKGDRVGKNGLKPNVSAQKKLGGGVLRELSHEIDYLNDEYKLNLQESEDYETLGGLILDHLENIPEAGTRVEIDGIIMEITEVSDNRINTVRLYK